MVAVRGGAPARKTTQVFGVPSYLTMKNEKPSILIAVETGRRNAQGAMHSGIRNALRWGGDEAIAP
jgi:hypothetical protein